METKVKEALKCLEGCSYIIGVVDEDDSGAVASRGTTNEVIKLMSTLLSRLVQEAAEDIGEPNGKVFAVIFKEIVKETTALLITEKLTEGMDIETALDPDLLKGLKEDLLC